MTTATVEMRLTLAQNMAQKLHEVAQARGVTEEAVVQQALDLLFEMDDTSPLKDYWFSVAAMRPDWDAMPEDWIADEVSLAIPTR
jgi:hypothetical protein